MKKILFPAVMILSLCLSGCSVPNKVVRKDIYSFTKEEKRNTIGFDTKKKIVLFKDFRLEKAYAEDVTALKEEAEKYIADHPELSEAVKGNLRNLRVAEGMNKEEVELLLGSPDKASRASGRGRYNATEVWIYRISKLRAFTVFIIPVFFVHEGYYLYFKDDVLAGIEHHLLSQMVHQSGDPGILGASEKTLVK